MHPLGKVGWISTRRSTPHFGFYSIELRIKLNKSSSRLGEITEIMPRKIHTPFRSMFQKKTRTATIEEGVSYPCLCGDGELSGPRMSTTLGLRSHSSPWQCFRFAIHNSLSYTRRSLSMKPTGKLGQISGQ